MYKMKFHGRKKWLYGIIGTLNIAVGVMFYVVSMPLPTPTINTAFVVQRQRPPQVVPAIVGTPTRVVVPSLSIDLSVGVGSFNSADGTWSIDTERAFYADTSLPVNDSNGNTLIYGHAQPQVFGSLPQIKTGVEAVVYTDNGYIFHYQYQSVKNVLPSDVSVFTAEGPPTLVLQTCIGDWDAYRALFSFSLVSKEKA